MKRFAISFLAALALLPRPASAELNFVLQHKGTVADAIATDKPFITDGDSKIYLQFLGNWGVIDGASKLEFTPTVAGSLVRLGKYNGPDLPIDQAGGRALLQSVVAQLPEGAKNVVALPMDINPLPLFGWTDLEVSVRYEFFGQMIRRSQMFVHMRPGRLVEFSVTAPDAEFGKVYKPARAILSSWFEPSRDLPPDLASQYEEQAPPK